MARAFAASKRETLRLMAEADRSPKGSVDAPVAALLADLNALPAYVSLSSCSGRIAVYAGGGAKGEGRWLWVSHEAALTVGELTAALAEAEAADGSSLSLLVEELVLHVQAVDVAAARALLTAAIGAGFRESGMTVGSGGKIVVGIRSTAHALDIPLRYEGVTLAPPSYVAAVVPVVNAAFGRVCEHRRRFEAALRSTVLAQPATAAVAGGVGAAATIAVVVDDRLVCRGCEFHAASRSQLFIHLRSCGAAPAPSTAPTPAAGLSAPVAGTGAGAGAGATIDRTPTSQPPPPSSPVTAVSAAIATAPAAVSATTASAADDRLVCRGCGFHAASRSQLFAHLRGCALARHTGAAGDGSAPATSAGLDITAADRAAAAVAQERAITLLRRRWGIDRGAPLALHSWPAVGADTAASLRRLASDLRVQPPLTIRWQPLLGAGDEPVTRSVMTAARSADSGSDARHLTPLVYSRIGKQPDGSELSALHRWGAAAAVLRAAAADGAAGSDEYVACFGGFAATGSLQSAPAGSASHGGTAVAAAQAHSRSHDLLVAPATTLAPWQALAPGFNPSSAASDDGADAWPSARTRHTLTPLSLAGDATAALLFGGHAGLAAPLADAWLLRLRVGEGGCGVAAHWTRLRVVSPAAPSPRWAHCAVALPAGALGCRGSGILVFGGRDAMTSSAEAWLGDIDIAAAAIAWRLLACDGAASPGPRYAAAAALLPSAEVGGGAVLVHGGFRRPRLYDEADASVEQCREREWPLLGDVWALQFGRGSSASWQRVAVRDSVGRLHLLPPRMSHTLLCLQPAAAGTGAIVLALGGVTRSPQRIGAVAMSVAAAANGGLRADVLCAVDDDAGYARHYRDDSAAGSGGRSALDRNTWVPSHLTPWQLRSCHVIVQRPSAGGVRPHVVALGGGGTAFAWGSLFASPVAADVTLPAALAPPAAVTRASDGPLSILALAVPLSEGEAAKRALAAAGLLDACRVGRRVNAAAEVLWVSSGLEQSLFPRFGDTAVAQPLLALPVNPSALAAWLQRGDCGGSLKGLPEHLAVVLAEGRQCAVGPLLPTFDLVWASLPAFAGAPGDTLLPALTSQLTEWLRGGGADEATIARLTRPGAVGGVPRRVEWIGGDVAVLPADSLTDEAWLAAADVAWAGAGAGASAAVATSSPSATGILASTSSASSSSSSSSAHATPAVAMAAPPPASDAAAARWSPLWRAVAAVLRAPRLVRQARIDAGGTRASRMQVLWSPAPRSGAYALPGDGPAAPLPPMPLEAQRAHASASADGGEPAEAVAAATAALAALDVAGGTWVRHREFGTTWQWDVSRLMFSRGNHRERARLSDLLREAPADVVVDCFAGQGYFTVPLLAAGGARFVHACEWNPDALATLRLNLVANGIDRSRYRIWPGDVRAYTQDGCPLHGVAQRVLLGLLPTAEPFIPVAVRLLRPSGGWLHVHVNVGEEEEARRVESVRQQVATAAREAGCAWWHGDASVRVPHVQMVKSYAPRVRHVVVDVYCGGGSDGVGAPATAVAGGSGAGM